MERLLSNTLTKSTTKQNYKSLASIQSTASSSQVIDVLLSNVWPASITQLSSASLPYPELASIGVPPFDDTIRRTKPRYHFAAGGGQPPRFWEREPFVWADEETRPTRFVSLGAFGGEPTTGKKQRVCIYSWVLRTELMLCCSGSTRFQSHPTHLRHPPLPTPPRIHLLSLLLGPRNARLLTQARIIFSGMFANLRNAAESVS